MKFEEFKSNLSKVLTTKGQRASYRNISVLGSVVRFTRDSTDKQEIVSIEELYNLYCNEDFINTVIARKYITGRVYSPSVAILKAAGLVSENGERIGFVGGSTVLKVQHKDRVVHVFSSEKLKETKHKTDKIKDETIFFRAFKTFLGPGHLYSKSIGYKIASSDVFLSDDYSSYRFKSEATVIAFQEILKALNGTNRFDSKSHSHHVDGLIHDHSILGNRIVEFDEEQHFTPARKDTLIILSKSMSIPYAERYVAICNDLEYLNNQVLKKHRIKPKLDCVPITFTGFIDWLKDANVSNSGYIASKPAFDYKGGRIAQRAYYDCLRDVAHHSEFNKRHKLKTSLRFAKYSFEKKYNKKFSELMQGEIIDGIKEILKTDYNI